MALPDIFNYLLFFDLFPNKYIDAIISNAAVNCGQSNNGMTALMPAVPPQAIPFNDTAVI